MSKAVSLPEAPRSVSCERASSSGRVPSRRSNGSRRTPARCPPASNAAWVCPTTRTSDPATSSRRSRSGRSRVPRGVAMHVVALSMDLHLPQVHSLKEKRSVIPPILAGCRHPFGVAAAEGAYQDLWQRAGLGFSVVASTPAHAAEVIDRVERFIWSFPEAEVLHAERQWLEDTHAW